MVNAQRRTKGCENALQFSWMPHWLPGGPSSRTFKCDLYLLASTGFIFCYSASMALWQGITQGYLLCVCSQLGSYQLLHRMPARSCAAGVNKVSPICLSLIHSLQASFLFPCIKLSFFWTEKSQLAKIAHIFHHLYHSPLNIIPFFYALR